MEIDDMTIKMLKKKKESLDICWDKIPKDSYSGDRYENRVLLYIKYKTPEMDDYLVMENAFIVFCQAAFGIEKLTFPEACELVDNYKIFEK